MRRGCSRVPLGSTLGLVLCSILISGTGSGIEGILSSVQMTWKKEGIPFRGTRVGLGAVRAPPTQTLGGFYLSFVNSFACYPDLLCVPVLPLHNSSYKGWVHASKGRALDEKANAELSWQEEQAEYYGKDTSWPEGSKKGEGSVGC